MSVTATAKKLFAVGVSSLAIAAAPLGTAVAAEAAPSAAACVKWTDSAGPGAAGRGHADCTGMNVYVVTTVNCADGSSSRSAKRWEYAKAECPYAIKARSVTFVTSKS
ncbi:hypothetical protein [Streptomyces lushanensis]|uniref:hypothetical protein n=1 Tax=Streptomyces lushanensis TaxID=1434255 RepID=UPI00082DD5B0|nr:hypothetical protein [Streptomyces lushanensis]